MGRIDDEIGTVVYGVAILCGGRSSRMGQDKAEMRIQAGGPRMVDCLLAAFSGCDEILLSVRDEKQLADHSGIIRVADSVSGAGPLAGIAASLRACRNGLLFVTAVDMPCMDRAFAEELLSTVEANKIDQKDKYKQEKQNRRADPVRDADSGENGEKMSVDWDVLVPVDPDGRLHPLCAFYRKSALPVLEESLRDGEYSLWRVFQKLRVRRVPAETLEDSARKLMNLNRPEDVQRKAEK